jgi:hypothetical protein
MKHHNAALVAIVALSIITVCIPVARSQDQSAPPKPAGSTLRIVNDSLMKVDDGDCIGCLYAVKGSIYNPNSNGVKNVVIRYYILPPKQTIDFMATSHDAPAMSQKSGLMPDPISAEVTAEWDE